MTTHRSSRQYELLADEPVLLHNPRRQLVKLLTLYAALPLICATAGAYVAYMLAMGSVDQRLQGLERDMAERRTAARAEDRARDERLAQTRRDLCVALDRLNPRDAPVQDLRRRYGCTTPGPAPSPQPSTSGGGRPAGGRVDASPAPRPGPTRGPAGPTGPAGPEGPPGKPAPSPPPEPTPEPRSRPALLCVPLLDLCV
ncbi:hypothetical protein ACFYPX_09150 [Micromonospora zamorensis]|uniref:hypothetical protein n=1 Tax=Micromonospora zamorensis TaxID=709883 RepID=UPI0036B0E966